MLLSGTRIGDGAVIAARAVVRHRFSEKTIERLLRIRWWDWTIEKIKQHVPSILAVDVDEFARHHDPQG